jgi:hypothetical protein
MDSVKQSSWFSVTAYVLISLSVLGLLFVLAEAYFPSPSSSLIPREPDRLSRWLTDSSRWQKMRKSVSENPAQQDKLFLRLDQKLSAGKAELIYRGLAGQDEFRIDVIIPELDPHAVYPYRFTISEAKKNLRLANRNYQLIAAKKWALQLKQIQ